MITLKADAIVSVPVNLVPLIDDSDFKTRETSIAYNATGMDLVWNFITPEGLITQTAVTPTSGGVYDWSHEGDGMYSIIIPESAGGSINNDTTGFGYFTGLITGVLPFRGPTIRFTKSAAVVLAPSGSTIYAIFFDVSGKIWNSSTYETYDVSNWATYDVAMTETGGLGHYTVTSPYDTATHFVAFRQVGGSPAATDVRITGGSL